MKRKIIVLFTVISMVMALFVFSVQAAGDYSGSSLENAFSVTNETDLNNALADATHSFIEVTGAIQLSDDLEIPAGKTVIIQKVDGVEYALNAFDSYYSGMGQDVIVDAGGTLINNGGIVCTVNSSLEVLGTLENNDRISHMSIVLTDDGSLVNKAGAVISDNCTILFYAGNILNEGTIGCVVHQIGLDTECTMTGVDASNIRQTNDPIFYVGLTYLPITLSGSQTASIGMSGDDSTLIIDPYGWCPFAKGYSIELEEDQTLVLQSSTAFYPTVFLLEDNGAGLPGSLEDTSWLEGMRYTAEDTQTYYILMCGYDTYDAGSFTVTVYDADENTDATLDFTKPAPPASGAGWTWDAGTSTLTLNGLLSSVAEGTGIILPDDATLVLADGSNNFIQNNVSTGIYCEGSFSITGGGNLTINAGWDNGIYTSGNLSIQSLGELNIYSNDRCGIYCDGSLSIMDSPSIHAGGDMAGIGTNGDLTISNSMVQARGYYFGINSYIDYFLSVEREMIEGPMMDLLVFDEEASMGGDIIITNSRVDAACFEGAGYAAIFAGDDVPADVTEGHSKIILTGCGVLTPETGYVVDVSIMKYQPNLACQTISSVAGLTIITDWEPAVDKVMIYSLHDILYDANGGTGTLADANNSYFYGESATILANSFARLGYTFTGWNTAANGTGTGYASGNVLEVSKTVTLYALWQINTFTVNFVDWDSSALKTQVVNYGAAATAPTSPSRSGYTFNGWDVAFASITANLTVKAQYTPAAVLAATVVPTATPTASPTATPTTSPTTSPTATPTATPTAVAAAALVKTGDIDNTGIIVLLLAFVSISVLAVREVLRRRVENQL